MLSHLKTLLLVSEAFPQFPIRPLGHLTAPPHHSSLQLAASHGLINADLFLPAGKGPHPALVYAMGVKTADRDRPVILGFAKTMSRLGFAVLWPRLAVLDEGHDLPEEPATFVEAFRYLAAREEVASGRISYLGFSIGSSLAFVAAADQAIASDVRALVFFGGFYDVDSYLLAMASSDWSAADDAQKHFREVLTAKGGHSLVKVLDARSPDEARALLSEADPAELARLRRLSPSHCLGAFRAPIFILHDKGDTYVPYTESVALRRALAHCGHSDPELRVYPERSRREGEESRRGEGVRAFLIVDLFEHVQPNRLVTWKDAGELLKLYGFIRRTLAFL